MLRSSDCSDHNFLTIGAYSERGRAKCLKHFPHVWLDLIGQAQTWSLSWEPRCLWQRRDLKKEKGKKKDNNAHMWHRLFGEGGGGEVGVGGVVRPVGLLMGLFLWTPCSKFKPKNLLNGANDRDLILVGTKRVWLDLFFLMCFIEKAVQKREFLNSKQLNYGTAEHVYSLITVLPLTLMDFLAVSPKPPLANLIGKKKPFGATIAHCLVCIALLGLLLLL